MLVDITENVLVDAPPATVWALVTDIRRHPEFAGPKSITKAVEFDGPVAPGRSFVAHERFGPRRFDAPSDILAVDPERELRWVSFPPMKERNRGEGGRVFWRYGLRPEGGGTRLEHQIQVIEPRKGAGSLRLFYKVCRLPKKQRRGILTSLCSIKAEAERNESGHHLAWHPPPEKALQREQQA